MEQNERIAERLRLWSERREAPGFLAIGRRHTIGEPALWEERISYERGRRQSFTRVRSPADEGGAAIGSWSLPAEEPRLEGLLASIAQTKYLERVAEQPELSPGMDLVAWVIATEDGLVEHLAPAGSELRSSFAPLDLELRRLASALEASRQGHALRVELDVQHVGSVLEAQVALRNDGLRPCFAVNPCALEPAEDPYLRLELAPIPPEEDGVTGPGFAFETLPLLPRVALEGTPWAMPWLLLQPGQALVYPARAKLGAGKGEAHLLRAVYSSYAPLAEIAGVPVVRGRAFSNELEVAWP